MNNAKVYAISTFLFIGFLFSALLLNTTEAADWLVYQGPCSEFPDCNKNCIGKGSYGWQMCSTRAADAAQQGANEAAKAGQDVKNKAAEDVTQKAKDAAGKVADTAQDLTEKAKQTAQHAWGTVKDTTQKIKETVVGKAEDSKESVKKNTETVKRSVNMKN